jgi:hypothetical protein
MDELIQGAKDRLRNVLIIEKDLRETLEFDEFEDMPKEYVELREAFNKVIDSEYYRFRGTELVKEKAIVSGETMAYVADQIRREMRD